MKYVNTDVVFQEIPDEVTLAINISNCPCRCPGCHSRYLWSDMGEPLNERVIDRLLDDFGGDITCISFMGGDADPARVNRLARHIRENHPSYKTAWWTGRTLISGRIDRTNFNYIKVGPFIRHLGPLSSTTTNQRLYRIDQPGSQMVDITSRFWRHK